MAEEPPPPQKINAGDSSSSPTPCEALEELAETSNANAWQSFGQELIKKNEIDKEELDRNSLELKKKIDEPAPADSKPSESPKNATKLR
mmetsp:Transcript_52670/g.120031  ORF Transcript_52670/g.120031 Transcript_52670/m.120031 type:complete len:89 (+) Transcript_52670:186-452(+)